MTAKQALTQARKRWGKNAAVRDGGKQTILDGHVMSERYRVGRIEMGMFFCVEADGETWEQAFKNADKKTVNQTLGN